jgi:hypothetical protein
MTNDDDPEFDAEQDRLDEEAELAELALHRGAQADQCAE